MKRVHLRGVGEDPDLGSPDDFVQVHRGVAKRRGKTEVVTVAVGGADGFEFELLQRVVQRRTKFHTPSAQVGRESARARIKRALSFTAARQPAEPVDIAAVRGGAAIAKGVAVVLVPVHLSGQTDLTQIAEALNAPRRGFAARQRRQQQRGQHGDDREDGE